MAFTLHLNPHHIHIANGCMDHANCDISHWIGGRPQVDHSHHVEVDCSTGLVGYTRLTSEEITKKAKEDAASLAEKAAREADREKNLDVIRKRAKNDEAFAALLTHLGISND